MARSEASSADAPADSAPLFEIDRYFIKPKSGPDLFVGVEGNSELDGALVKEGALVATDDSQEFYLIAVKHDTWRVAMSANSAGCLESAEGQPPTTPIRMWTCQDDYAWQQWVITPEPGSPNTYRLKNRGNGLYLAQPTAVAAEGLTLQVSPQADSDAQRWVIIPTMPTTPTMPTMP